MERTIYTRQAKSTALRTTLKSHSGAWYPQLVLHWLNKGRGDRPNGPWMPPRSHGLLRPEYRARCAAGLCLVLRYMWITSARRNRDCRGDTLALCRVRCELVDEPVAGLPSSSEMCPLHKTHFAQEMLVKFDMWPSCHYFADGVPAGMLLNPW